MGVLFIAHPNGSTVYHCADCGIPLTNRDALISTRFNGERGRAWLFDYAVNTVEGKRENREMTTGQHFIRRSCCKSCNGYIGWYGQMFFVSF